MSVLVKCYFSKCAVEEIQLFGKMKIATFLLVIFVVNISTGQISIWLSEVNKCLKKVYFEMCNKKYNNREILVIDILSHNFQMTLEQETSCQEESRYNANGIFMQI